MDASLSGESDSRSQMTQCHRRAEPDRSAAIRPLPNAAHLQQSARGQYRRRSTLRTPSMRVMSPR
jgi:hypothetical protein